MRRIIVTLIIICLITSVYVVYIHKRGIEVVVVNEGDEIITNLSINFTGGSYSIEGLEPGTSYRVIVKSTGESSLTVEFEDSHGNTKSELIDVYFEPNYRGTIYIYVNTITKTIRWESSIKTW